MNQDSEASRGRTPTGSGPAGWLSRQVAVDALLKVQRGEFTAAALDQVLNQSGLTDERDRALATELAYGVVRTQPVLEQQLHDLAPKGIAGGDTKVLMHLLVAAYQLSFLDRVPAFAAVNLAVTAIEQLRGKRVGGFANAVLRRLQPKADLTGAVRASAPEWLVEQMALAVGEPSALGLLGVHRGTHETTPQCVRLVGAKSPPDWLSQAEAGALSPKIFRLRKAGDVRRHPEFAEGGFVVQEEGAAFMGRALGARPSERALDVCAGRGQKSSLVAEQLGPEGELWASDLSDKKLLALNIEFDRLGLPSPQRVRHDWKEPCSTVPRDFDRVLVDAPCSGTGTLRRRPEIARRLGAADVERLASLSEQILRNAAAHVQPTGRLVFVVCSVLRDECEAVVERVADVLAPATFDSPEVVERFGAVSQFRLLPDQHGTDGFFGACFRRRT